MMECLRAWKSKGILTNLSIPKKISGDTVLSVVEMPKGCKNRKATHKVAS